MGILKNYILVVVVGLIIWSIYSINSIGVKNSGSGQTINIAPKISSSTPSQTGDNQQVNSQRLADVKEKSSNYELAKEITTPDGFINTDGKHLAINDFIGKKVILIDFWTYSCINCQRTTPYLNSWYEKYKDKGLVIIGIHTPEFEFEKDYNNVKAAVEKFGIKFPVVLDNDYSTWSAYRNLYWPRKYLIDIDGYIVYDHIGEGGYEETEQKIQKALSEKMAVLNEKGVIDQSLTKESYNQISQISPETYFGSARNDQQANLLFPSNSWNITPEFAQNTSANANIVYTYTAKDVFFVA